MRNLLAILGGLIGSVAGFSGTLWLTTTFHPGSNGMWPLSALEYSFIFGFPLGTITLSLVGHRLGTIMGDRGKSEPSQHGGPIEPHSANKPSDPAAPRRILLRVTVPVAVGLLLTALAIFPLLPGNPNFFSFPLLLASWFVIPALMFLAYVLWLRGSHPKASPTERPPSRWDVVARRFLKVAGILGPLASGIASLLFAITAALNDIGSAILFLVFLAYVCIPAHVLAGCLFLCGLCTQAFAERWQKGWTLWNGIYAGIVLLLLSAAFAFY